jgi:hypothetical protein
VVVVVVVTSVTTVAAAAEAEVFSGSADGATAVGAKRPERKEVRRLGASEEGRYGKDEAASEDCPLLFIHTTRYDKR